MREMKRGDREANPMYRSAVTADAHAAIARPDPMGRVPLPVVRQAKDKFVALQKRNYSTERTLEARDEIVCALQPLINKTVEERHALTVDTSVKDIPEPDRQEL